jgi:hypothetical protein
MCRRRPGSRLLQRRTVRLLVAVWFLGMFSDRGFLDWAQEEEDLTWVSQQNVLHWPLRKSRCLP